MTDQYALVQADFVTQLRTIADPYFKAVVGRAAGWQVSDDDTIVFEGGEYFAVYRPGQFNLPRANRKSEFNDNEWHISLRLYYRYTEYASLWSTFETFRDAVIHLPDTSPLRNHGITGQEIRATEDAGYLIDSQGSYTQIVVQTLDVTIWQRVNKKHAA